MHSLFHRFLVLLAVSLSLLPAARGVPQNGGGSSTNPPQAKKLPTNVILNKGAWPSASDSVTPLPEGGRVTNNVYGNDYFGLTYALSPDWTESYAGPPPSDSGYYVLAQIKTADTFKGPDRGNGLITAQDMFFSLAPAGNALELINYSRDKLNAEYYKVEQAPAVVRIADHSFVRFDFVAPVSDLHWYVLATQIRCHEVQFVFTSRDTKLLDSLIQDLSKMKLPAEADLLSGMGGGEVPVCIKDYAQDENIVKKVDPFFSDRRFNPVPVRIIVDKEGKVKHIHFLRAFPEQAKAISDALEQWQFRPYLVDGKPVEVETGIMFGHAPRAPTPPRAAAISK
jgi:hypothetical protein